MTSNERISGMNGRIAVVCVLVILAAVYLYLHEDISVPVNKPFSTFPVKHGEWTMTGESFMTDPVLEKLRPTDYLLRAYQNERGERVTVYIGFHGGGKEGGEIHSPKHCLPGSGWFEVYSRKSTVDTSMGAINLVKALYRKGESKQLFIYWFQVRGDTIDNEYSLKLAEIANSAIHRRRDAAFIRISVPFVNDESVAMQVGSRFISDFYPLLHSYLPK